MTAPSAAETPAPLTQPPPPPPPPPSYAAPQPGYQYGTGAPAGATNGMAVASLVLGILTIVTCGIGSILAVIFGYVGKGQIDRSGGTQSGRGLAIAGIVLGWVGIGIIIVIILLAIIGAINDAGSSQQGLVLLG